MSDDDNRCWKVLRVRLNFSFLLFCSLWFYFLRFFLPTIAIFRFYFPFFYFQSTNIRHIFLLFSFLFLVDCLSYIVNLFKVVSFKDSFSFKIAFHQNRIDLLSFYYSNWIINFWSLKGWFFCWSKLSTFSFNKIQL